MSISSLQGLRPCPFHATTFLAIFLLFVVCFIILDHDRSVNLPRAIPGGLDNFIRAGYTLMADLLFRVPFRIARTDLEILVALLIEAQASPDRTMGFRLLRYLVHYRERKSGSGRAAKPLLMN